MRKSLGIALVAMALCLLICPPARPQTGAVTSAVNRLPDGHVNLVVANTYHAPITAMVLVVQGARIGGPGHFVTTRYLDTLLNPWRDKALEPGESRTFGFGGSHPGPSVFTYNPQLTAAVFEDGTSFGDPQVVNDIIQARKIFFEELGKAITLLQEVQTSGLSENDVLQRAAELGKSEMPQAPTVEERRAVDNVWGTVRANLQQSRPNVSLSQSAQSLAGMFLGLRQGLISSKPQVTPPGATVNPTVQ